eukprot:TRINITY_DN3484_c0_g1_i1.p1 TRINITY_DN3484_c0_g1~~TRINITY_DN3484_c0_g1_i1.p1  ORF type:complete len:433 (-),score=143.29 TRINITY_DN3484_c0_g1_i1:57-1355(-)
MSSKTLSHIWEEKAVKSAIKQGIISDRSPLALFFNFSYIRRLVGDLKAAYPENTLHSFAAKANPLKGIFDELNRLGMGAETASLGELTQALRSFSNDKVVFDSPVKTLAELEFSIKSGIYINLDNFQELERFAHIVDQVQTSHKLRVGLRINPQVGGGSIGTHSTSTATSKFGIPLSENRDKIIEAFKKYSWLKGLHVHVGSQGCPLELICGGIRETYDLSLEIDKQCKDSRIQFFDIGGGLPTNFESFEDKPTFDDHASVLRRSVPELFERKDLLLITEFGRSLLAKPGFFVSRVEYTKVCGGRHIALQHVGADLAIRTVYHPDKWQLRIGAYDSQGDVKTTQDTIQDLGGPCCIGGDIIAHQRLMPLLEQGDSISVRDVGAYYHSSYSYYNSRQAPPVYSFEETENENGQVSFTLIKKGDTVDDTLRFFT